MISKNKNLLIITLLTVTASLTIGILREAVNAQNQSSSSNTGAVCLRET